MSESTPTKAFVDTTILADVLLEKNPSALAALRRFDETELPMYAIKEFKAGALVYWVWLHNKLVDTESYVETAGAIRRVHRQQNRMLSAFEALEKIQEEFKSLALDEFRAQYGTEATTVDKCLMDYCRLQLARRIRQAWRLRRSITTRVVLPLKCYSETDPFERRGRFELRPTACIAGLECCVAADMKRAPENIRLLRAAIKPDKQENIRRSQVLRQLIRKPNEAIDNTKCRHIGDAAFAFFAPADSVILTTNTRDHQPLAEALGKQVAAPEVP